MNDRKQHVINKAHQLFIEKGFQATSIQDILDYSGISKGTFYNYFPSKNELLMALFTSLSQRIDHERNELLIGQDPANIEIFIQQLELQMAFNRRNKLLTLFEEVFVSNDPTLKQFLKRTQIMHLRWTYNRFVDIFGKSRQPYLLDCAIMFTGLLHHNIHFHFLANEMEGNINQVIKYSVERIVNIVDDVGRTGAQLLKPEVMQKWLPDCNKTDQEFEQNLNYVIKTIKKHLTEEDRLKSFELLDFIQEETLHSSTPRKYLINSAVASLKENPGPLLKKELRKLEDLINHFYTINS